MKVRKILTMVLATALTLGMTSNILVSNMVYAKESTETVWTEDVSNEFFDDNKTVDTAETADIATFALDESQMTEEQQSIYEQVLSGERYELGVGESVVIGSDAEGEISITCVSSSTSPARASWETSNQTYNINKTILGQETLLATVDLECTWYKNGEDGYIKNLKGTYTEKNSAWLCEWEDNKIALPYYHALMLRVLSMGSSHTIVFGADYYPSNEKLLFSVSELK